MKPVRSGSEISYATERLLVKAVEVIYDDRAVLLPGFETILPDCINPLCVNCAQMSELIVCKSLSLDFPFVSDVDLFELKLG